MKILHTLLIVFVAPWIVPAQQLPPQSEQTSNYDTYQALYHDLIYNKRTIKRVTAVDKLSKLEWTPTTQQILVERALFDPNLWVRRRIISSFYYNTLSDPLALNKLKYYSNQYNAKTIQKRAKKLLQIIQTTHNPLPTITNLHANKDYLNTSNNLELNSYNDEDKLFDSDPKIRQQANTNTLDHFTQNNLEQLNHLTIENKSAFALSEDLPYKARIKYLKYLLNYYRRTIPFNTKRNDYNSQKHIKNHPIQARLLAIILFDPSHQLAKIASKALIASGPVDAIMRFRLLATKNSVSTKQRIAIRLNTFEKVMPINFNFNQSEPKLLAIELYYAPAINNALKLIIEKGHFAGLKIQALRLLGMMEQYKLNYHPHIKQFLASKDEENINRALTLIREKESSDISIQHTLVNALLQQKLRMVKLTALNILSWLNFSDKIAFQALQTEIATYRQTSFIYQQIQRYCKKHGLSITIPSPIKDLPYPPESCPQSFN